MIVVAIFGDVCTHGLLYSVGRLPDRATDRAAHKRPKVQKNDRNHRAFRALHMNDMMSNNVKNKNENPNHSILIIVVRLIFVIYATNQR